MGRKEDMHDIASAVESCDGNTPSRYAVWGMPGLGKSQLALSYANASFDAGRHTHVVWIPATTLEKVNQGLVKVLDLTQHVDRNNPDQGARLTAARLCLEQFDQRLKWLIIVDDATSATLHFLREHLPRQNSHGSILITTRTFDVAKAVTSVAGQQHPVRELKALSTEQSVELLFKNAGIDSGATSYLESAQKLVKQIGCLPLAVEQAGSYMRRSGLGGAGQLATLHDREGLEEIICWDNHLSTYQEKSVLTTITVQLQSLGDIDPDFLKLLKTLAFFDPESIPLDIIVLGAGRVARLAADQVSDEVSDPTLAFSPTPLPKQSLLRKWIRQFLCCANESDSFKAERYNFQVLPGGSVVGVSPDVSVELKPLLGLICSEKWLRGALCHLEDLSLAQPRYDEKPSLHIHDLIQLVLQQRMSANRLGEDPHCALAMTLLCEAFKTIGDVGLPHSWAECERFVPHLMALLKHAGKPTPELLSMQVAVGWYFSKRGRYDEAEALYQKALASQEEQLGINHPSTLVTVNNLAILYKNRGKYTAAEILHQRALAGQEEQLGANHPSTLDTLNSLATLYEKQGKYTAAEILYQRALAGQEHMLGVNHPSTLGTVYELAWLYNIQGKYTAAEILHLRALAGQEEQLGENHPSTLDTLNSLAILHGKQGKYTAAEILYQRALAGQEQMLGADHPSTLSTVSNLALLYENQGKYTKAEILYQRALAGQEQMLGADHPSTLNTVNNFAMLYEKQGKYKEAKSFYQRALAGKEQKIGPDHPHTLYTIHHFACLYAKQGNYDEAEMLYQRALAGRGQKLGANHPETLETIHSIANLRVQQDRLEEAETLFNRALAGRVKAIGVHHPDTIASMEDLACLYDKQGRLEEARMMRDKVLQGT